MLADPTLAGGAYMTAPSTLHQIVDALSAAITRGDLSHRHTFRPGVCNGQEDTNHREQCYITADAQ